MSSAELALRFMGCLACGTVAWARRWGHVSAACECLPMAGLQCFCTRCRLSCYVF